MTDILSSSELLAMIHRAGAAAVNAQAELGLERTRKLVPTDPGTELRDSLTITEATPEDRTAQLYTDLPYAVWQHEALYNQHDDGQAKYMESAVVGADSKNRMSQAAAQAALRELGG